MTFVRIGRPSIGTAAEPLPRLTAAWIDVAVKRVLWFDGEFRSVVDLKEVGLHKYATHPTTDVWFVAFAIDDGPVQIWSRGDPVPAVWFEAAADPSWAAHAHNAAFDVALMQHVVASRYGFPIIPLERCRCTMAMALALGLPAKLGALADALELVNRKDAAGERLMRLMSKPRKPRPGEDPAGTYWHDEPEKLQRLRFYVTRDAEVLREAGNCLLALPAAEQALWEHTCQINQRGFHIDRPFAKAARQIAQAAAPEIDAELAELTGGAVTAINQIRRLQTWLTDQGCPIKKLEHKALEKLLLNGELMPVPVRRVLELRLGGAQAAVKKIDSLLARAGDDDRVRNAFRYHGAATGRWSGEGFQPQNLKRPIVEDLDAAIAAVATGDYQHVKERYPRPLAVVGDCSRSMITAAPGHVLIGADFSAIESRVLAWVAGEEWKLDAYRRYDATRDPIDEPYVQTAAKVLSVSPATIAKDQRAIGKTCDLSFGYMGGLSAWRKFQPDKPSDAEVEIFKTNWRAKHPKIRRFWYDIDNAAVLAVRERGQIVRCGRIDLKCTGAFLQIKLPSGRKLSYPQPRIITDKNGKLRVSFVDNAGGKFVDCRFGQGAYGGTWTENIVSGIARDILVEAMFRVEAAGYPIVLTVHDEIVCDVPEGFGSAEEFTRLMTRKPAWALDLPIAASAWTGPRYCK